MESVSEVLESSVRDELTRVLGRVQDLRSGVTYPDVMRSFDAGGEDDPGDLTQAAQVAASQREFTGSRLAAARAEVRLAREMVRNLRERVEDARDVRLSTEASRLISRGMAIQERVADANLSLVDRMIDVRASEFRLTQIEVEADFIEAVHRAWRDAEFGLDRLARLLQFRHALGEI